MVLKIRLRQQGRTNRLTYRLIVADSRSPRDGKYIENLGCYDPHVDGNKDAVVKEDRLEFWLNHGAQLTEKAHAIVARKSPGILRKIHEKQLQKNKKHKNKSSESK